MTIRDRQITRSTLKTLEARIVQARPQMAARPLSMAEQISMLPDGEREETLAMLAPTPEDLRLLEYSWDFWARPNQKEPEGNWNTWLLMSGRGFGKTRVGAEAVIKRAQMYPRYAIALIGQTKADVRDTMAEVFESSIMKISPPWFMPRLETTKRRLTWPNGAQAIMYSGDEPDQLRGPQHGFGWLDEVAKFKYPQETWSNFSLGLRLGPNPQCIITTTPRAIPLIKELNSDPAVIKTVGSTYENVGNLPQSFIRTILSRYEGTRLGAQEIYGSILGDVDGALWNRDTLERVRVVKIPEMVRIVVAVDPSTGGSASGGTAETGIVIAGIGTDGHCYILEDASLNTNKPERWGAQAVAAYNRYGADRIVCEVNQGGEMVRSTLHTIDDKLPITMVHASKGKYTRAEPVSSLYSQGRVHHLGMFADLEDQLCSWVPGEPSPDRLDALVWAVTEVLIRGYGGMDIETLASVFNYL
jgi:phage terminase large subunit-like protein